MPKLTIVVIVYNMRREAPRTLFSLSPEYQEGVGADDYEVVVVDNGSPEPPDREMVARFGPSFRYFRIEDASPSPAAALNFGIAQSRSPYLGLMIDGARLATPGVVREALACLRAFPRPVVGTLGFHLGPELQSISLQHGYDAAVEDRLLEEIRWRESGYRLFEIGALAGSNRYGAFHALYESNLLFLPRQLCAELGGFDERFDLPGGGLVNFDFYHRACALPRSTLITLLGEATFHQVHGGAITGKPLAEADELSRRYNAQYARLRGGAPEFPQRRPIFFGEVRPEVLPWFRKSCELVGKRSGERPRPLPEEAASDPDAGSPSADDAGRLRRRDADGALAFSLLSTLGLREHHRLLELGCGRLRAGRLFIPYLLPGHYYAIDPDEGRIREGIRHQVGEDLVTLKEPRFAHHDDFDLEVFGTGFDFILARSIFAHAGHAQVGHCLTSVRRALRPNGLLVAAFVELERDQAANVWVYPELTYYSWATMARIAAACGLHCRKIDWPHPLATWFVAAADLGRVEAITAAGVDLLPDELILTPARRRALDEGVPMGYYRTRRR